MTKKKFLSEMKITEEVFQKLFDDVVVVGNGFSFSYLDESEKKTTAFFTFEEATAILKCVERISKIKFNE